MKRITKWITGIGLACAGMGGALLYGAEVTPLSESFETDGLGSRYTVENGSDDLGSDYFARRQEFSAGTRTSGGTIDGEYSFAGRDIDADGDGTGVGTGNPPLEAREGQLTFNAFSIDGLGKLKISMAAAQGVNEFEFDNPLYIQVKIDDGEFETIGGFRGTFTNSPGRYFQGGLNTLPDHFVEPRLTTTFADFSWEIPGSGSTMQIRIRMNCNGSNEEYAIDNIKVSGDDAVEGFALSIDNAVVAETDGAGAATVTVTLDNAAPSGGATLDISLVSPLAVSGPEGEISVPETVTIAEGETVGTFDVDAVADGRFDGDVDTRIFVTGDGYNNEFITITTTSVDEAPKIILNEFQAAVGGSINEDIVHDANGDGVRNGGDDEFVEIVNVSGDGTAVDLSGWVISDDVGPRHKFPSGTVLADGRAIVVFGGGVPVGVFGGAIVQTASQGNLGWSNSGDTVNLDAGGASVFAVNYVDELGNVDPSAVREPELEFGDPEINGNYVLHDVATGSGGRLFSPGTRNDGVTPFGEFSNTATLALSADTIGEDAGAAAVTGTVTLENAAPAGGLNIVLESPGSPDRIDFSGDNVVESFVVNEVLGTTVRVVTLTIAEGATQGTFNVDVFDDFVLSGDRDWPIIVKEQDTIPDLAILTVTEVLTNPFNFVINEILEGALLTGEDANQNGTANEALDDQFIEIVNVSGFAVDISGWKLGSITNDNFGINRNSLEHVFPVGTVVNDQGAIVIFGGEGGVDGHLARMNDPEDLGPSFGNAIVQIANAGPNGLNLASAEALGFTSQLRNEHDFLMNEANYLRADAEQTQSLTRSPDLTGDFFFIEGVSGGPSLHFDVSPAFLPFSPGANISGEAFAGNGVSNDIGGTPVADLEGWFESGWFGFYAPIGTEGWIFHGDHGFVYYFPDNTADSAFIYDDAMATWWWTNSTVYPFIYAFDPPAGSNGLDIAAEWIYYFEGTTAPRSFGVVTGASAGSFLEFNP